MVSQSQDNCNYDKPQSVPNSVFQEDYAKVFEYCNTVNEHQFASHSSYSPTNRYSTLTLKCQIIAENGLKMNIRLMLDNCSNLSVLRRSIADKLDMSGSKISLDLSV